MKVTEVTDRYGKRRFLKFRRELYKQNKQYVDNNTYLLEEIFKEKLHFVKHMDILPVWVEEDGRILCEALLAHTDMLASDMQLCFFEGIPGQQEAVEHLLAYAEEQGRRRGCKRVVIGLYGHVNYGLGLLASHYDEKNSFSSPGNPAYYNDYFLHAGCETVWLNSYITHEIGDQLQRYRGILKKLAKEYTYRTFDKHEFERDAKLYTDLNNACFPEHRYYYARDYEDDREMLKELFLFMKPDSIVYAFRGDTPAGFIMWYPDYNELAVAGEAFGAKQYLKNCFMNKKIQTAKVMEYGVVPEYRGSGLPAGLIKSVWDILKSYGCTRVETSWILDENEDSNSFCQALCDEAYKRYCVYEKAIEPETI